MRIWPWAVNCEITTRCVTPPPFLDGSALVGRLINFYISTEISLLIWLNQDDEDYFHISLRVS
jgi:hypothetical protein